MSRLLDPSHEPWIGAEETCAVMRALGADEGNARFVGGAVRNALLGLQVDDIDIATPLLPDDVIRRLKLAAIKPVPTGIEHGTVTAVLGRKTFEVTTLRRDMETDGRHAIVAFSNSWEEDASRRDFTINALYASMDGEVFDYFEGLSDLEARRIRFIGDPFARIREDYLRILRLFRFHAWYGQGAMDEQALQAVKAERAGLQQLSGERIQKETLRLLAADDPNASLRVMAQTGVLEEIISGPARLGRLERLVVIEKANNAQPDAVLRLCALLPKDLTAASRVADRLKLSSANRDRVVDLACGRENLSPGMARHDLRKLLHRLGSSRVRDRIFLRWSEDADILHDPRWRDLLAVAEKWTSPTFPLSGRDVLAAGIQAGPRVGAILSQLEEVWVESDFTEDRAALLIRLNTVAQSSEH